MFKFYGKKTQRVSKIGIQMEKSAKEKSLFSFHSISRKALNKNLSELKSNDNFIWAYFLRTGCLISNHWYC